MRFAASLLGLKSISSCAEHVTLRKYFSHPSLVMHSFATPQIKLKLGQQIGIGTANRWGTTNSKPHGPFIMMGPIRNTEQHVDYIYYTLFCRCTALLPLVAPTVTCAVMLSQNHFPESNRYMLDFLHPFLLCRITY
jgi:hypothetical protein